MVTPNRVSPSTAASTIITVVELVIVLLSLLVCLWLSVTAKSETMNSTEHHNVTFMNVHYTMT